MAELKAKGVRIDGEGVIRDDKKLNKKVFYVEFFADTKKYPEQIQSNSISLNADLRNTFAGIYAKELGGKYDYETNQWFFDKENVYNQSYGKGRVDTYAELLELLEEHSPDWLPYVKKRWAEEDG